MPVSASGPSDLRAVRNVPVFSVCYASNETRPVPADGLMCLNESDQLKIQLSVNTDGASSGATVGPRIRLTFNLNYDVLH